MSMRLKARTWMVLGLVLVAVSAFWWWQSSRQQRARDAVASRGFQLHITNGVAGAQAAKAVALNSPFKVIATNLPNTLGGLAVSNLFAYRLSNTKEPFAKLLRNE